MDKKTKEQIKAEHPGKRLMMVSLDNIDGKQEFVLVAPSAAQFNGYVEQSMDDAVKAKAANNIVRQCVVYPAKEDFSKILETYPATLMGLFPHVLKLAGISISAETELF